MRQWKKTTEYTGKEYILNGKPIPVSKFQNAFLYRGTSLYEVVRLIDGTPLFLSGHLRRFRQSARLSGMDGLPPDDELIRSMAALREANGIDNGNVKILYRVSGGKEDLLTYFDNHRYPTKTEYRKGIKTGMHHAIRKSPNIKFLNMELRSQVRETKRETGYYELILVNSGGCVTEGSRSNLFFVRKDACYTPPIEDVLPGITREKIIRLCLASGITLRETPIRLEELTHYDAAFITGTSPMVLPVRSMDGVSYDPDHPVVRKLQKDYECLVRKDLEANSGWDKAFLQNSASL